MLIDSRTRSGIRQVVGAMTACTLIMGLAQVSRAATRPPDGHGVLLRLKAKPGEVIAYHSVIRMANDRLPRGSTSDQVIERETRERVVGVEGQTMTLESKIDGKCERMPSGGIGCTFPSRSTTVVSDRGAVLRSEAEGTSPAPTSAAWLPEQRVIVGTRWTVVSPARRDSPIPMEHTYDVLRMESVGGHECLVISLRTKPVFLRLGMHRAIGVGTGTIWFGWKLGRVVRSKASSTLMIVNAETEAIVARDGAPTVSVQSRLLPTE